MRATAALLVVVFHHLNTLREGAVPNLPTFDIGASGVDIFFVISGFIMWTTTTGQALTGATFMKRRIQRIVPLYWALTLVTVFITTSGGLGIDFDTDYCRLLKSLFFIPQWNAQYPIVAPSMIAGWTLELEMLFYAIFAAVLWLRPVQRMSLLLLVLSALTLLGLLVDSRVAVLEAYTNNIVLEFGMGVVLGRLHELGYLRGSDKAGIALLGLAAVLLGLRPYMPDLRCIYFGIPALLFVSGTLSLEPRFQGSFWRFPKFLGDASYSIYLVQMMAMAVSAKLLARFFSGSSIWATLLLQSGFATAAGCLVYLAVEKPLTAVTRQISGWRIESRADRRL